MPKRILVIEALQDKIKGQEDYLRRLKYNLKELKNSLAVYLAEEYAYRMLGGSIAYNKDGTKKW